MTTGSWNMILAFLNKDIISGAKQPLWTDFQSHLGKWVKLIKIEALNMGISTLEG